MDAERRAQIIRETKANVARYQNERLGLAADGASSARSAEARSAEDVSAFPAADRRPRTSSLLDEVDPIRKWREDGERLEAARAAGKAELRAAEREYIARLAPDFGEIDKRIEAALAREREIIFTAMQEGFRACSELADAIENRFADMELAVEKVRGLLSEARERTTNARARARARADEDENNEVIDLPSLPLVTKRPRNLN